MIKNQHYYQIDLLRFVAAFSVLLFHYSVRSYGANPALYVHYPFLDIIGRYGFLGVPLFFIISGFVISLSAEYSNAKNFLISRITRLYPAYWLCISLSAIIMLYFGGAYFPITLKQYLVGLTMLQSFFNVPDVDGVYWTLALEIQFYLFVFLLLFFKKFAYLEKLSWLWLLICCIILFVPHLTYVFIPRYAPYFIAGITFYKIKNDKLNAARASVLVITLAIAIYLTTQPQHLAIGLSFSRIAIGVILATFWLLFYLLVTNRLSSFYHPSFIKLGALTYPLYLIHENIGINLLNALNPLLNKWIALVITIGMMLFLAFLINQKIEKVFAPKLKCFLKKHLHA